MNRLLSPLNSVEKRRDLLIAVVTLFAIHAILSGWLIDPNAIQDADLQQSYQNLLNEYQLLMATFRGEL